MVTVSASRCLACRDELALLPTPGAGDRGTVVRVVALAMRVQEHAVALLAPAGTQEFRVLTDPDDTQERCWVQRELPPYPLRPRRPP
ncbi:hypothetical protein C5F51_36095 [Nocardia nova]|uniref:Uncharacterized protein n=1 Tax=Nocardia nova TaxID=37330 RepID=A0A2S5ZUM0_9NOCA|nr:hypothetical protein C5F51_36095 [Nocardia nova]